MLVFLLFKKVEMICKFACVKPTITNENIKNIKGTNIAYVKLHIIKINNIDYLMFDECDDIKESLVKEIEKIAKENDTSFNNVIVSMIETCLKVK